MARITFEGKRYPLRDDETVLEAMLRGGANIPFSCRKGTCHACMMHASEGREHLGPAASASLREDLREGGHFLPCKARPRGDVTVGRPDVSSFFIRARVERKELLSPRVVRLLLEPEVNMAWRAGQFMNVRRRDDGLTRSYSIASISEDDYFLELHVERVEPRGPEQEGKGPVGGMSRWLFESVGPGDELDLQGPVGSCFYSEELGRDRPLLLLGTGTGLSPLIGIARDALRRGHRGPIHLAHGGRDRSSLYFVDRLRALAAEHANFHYLACVSEGSGVTGASSRADARALPALAEPIERGRVVDVAFGALPELRGFSVFLCGSPEVVHEARTRAVLAGAARADIHADPFENAAPYTPNDAAKLASIEPEPALWEALRQGDGLTQILEDFYGRAYEDARLAPFFHKVTKRRAIEKQYEFLRDLFTGQRLFFGLRPFNAHHWMVISDELFDYREALLEDCMRRYGLSESLIRRWGALHERFRRDIVKATPRGLMLAGEEQPVDGHSEETIEVATLCNGCMAEMLVGAKGRLHVRTGELFCEACAARQVGMSVPPPAA